MKKYIIRIGGLIPTYFAGDIFTCHHNEAIVFDSIEAAISAWKSDRQVSVIDADTLGFVKWINY